jgi:large subunit ribosomal protein L3
MFRPSHLFVRALSAAKPAAAKAGGSKTTAKTAGTKSAEAAKQALKAKEGGDAKKVSVVTSGYTPQSRRTGVMAMKVGMLTMFDSWGVATPVTVLQMEGVVVLKRKEPALHGYCALVLAAGPAKAKHVNKPQMGEFAKAGLELRRRVEEFRVTPDALLAVGTKLDARHFSPGQDVDVCGVTIGKGFQGAMKLHGFRGQQETHGTSVSHRSLGATSACQDPGRTWKGKRMHARMGVDRVTTQNLAVFAVDPVRDLIFVKGCVAGHKGNYVRVTDSVKKPLQFEALGINVPFPTFVGPKPAEPQIITKAPGEVDPLHVE